MSRTKAEGGCLCGAVRFRAGGSPSHVNFCHCRMCQKASGAPMMAWATYPKAKVEFSGTRPRMRRSSAAVERGFCAECGSALVWQRTGADTIDLAVASFDDPNTLAPSEHIWTESRARWLTLTDHLPSYPKRKGNGKAKEAT